MKILLVGGAGFVGHHLERALTEKNHEVFIADRFNETERDLHHWAIDLRSRSSIESVLTETSPDCIFHLAALSSVSCSWKTPEETFQTNLLGTLHLFHSVMTHAADSRFIFVGSGEEYGGNCSETAPFTEESACQPRNPYAVSKLAAGLTLDLLTARTKMRHVHLRPMNHYGPFQREGFVIADFCAQIARAEQGKGSRILRVGNLEAKRDFLYIEDIISAYITLVEATEYPNRVYNLSSGQVCSIHDILHHLLSMSKVPISVEIDPEKFRPVELPVLVSSAKRMSQDFGWQPKYSLKAGLEKTLNWWREKIQAETEDDINHRTFSNGKERDI